MAALYVLAGIMHFVKPKMYMRIMPRYLPNHKTLVLLSGLAEIILGTALLFKETKAWANELRAKGQAGDYFFSISRYIFVVSKPA